MPLAKWWYNTSFHSTIQTTPYEVVYGQPLPLHLPYLAKESTILVVDKSLQASESVIKLLKFYLVIAQNRMKQQADKERFDRQFEVRNWVYVKLQPYRQSTMVNKKYLKLSANFFGPYKVLERIGVVAYKIELPKEAKIHPIFHVSN